MVTDAWYSGSKMTAMTATLSALAVSPASWSQFGDVIARCRFDTTLVETAEEALYELNQRPFDALVVASPLGGIGVTGLCEQVRRRRVHAPVLVVTRAGGGYDWAHAICAGADDCTALPDSFELLRARVIALTRHWTAGRAPVHRLRLGELLLELDGRAISSRPPLLLSPVQTTLLFHLVLNAGKSQSTTALMGRVIELHGPISQSSFDAELESLRDAVGVTSGVSDALRPVRGSEWCLVGNPGA